MTTNQQKKKQKQRNKVLELSGIAAQMGITIFLGAYAGKYLDDKFPSNKKWFTIGLTLAAVGISLYNILRQLNKINERDD